MASDASGVTHGSTAKVAPPEPARSAVAPIAAPSPSAATDAPVDPLDRITVNSWWKLGGTPAALDLAVDACVDRLGAEYRPDPAVTVVTRGLLACLRESGWHALGGL